jgi:senataxin
MRSTAVHAGRYDSPQDKGPSKKILICAPSNAAIDEVAYRIKAGRRGKTKVIRVGADKKINISVKNISLDHLIDEKFNKENIAPVDSSSAMKALREEIQSIKNLRQEKFDELSKVQDNTARTLALENEVKQLGSQRTILSRNLDKLKDKQKSDARSFDALRRKFRDQILSEADVICATLSGAGHELLEQLEYEIIVIDEAAQAVELSSLIPLRYSCRSCILVGGAPFSLISGDHCNIPSLRSPTTGTHCSISGGKPRRFNMLRSY